MFDAVAARYDLTNDVLSLGQTRLWRRAVTRAVDAQPGARVLDLAAGTGSSSQPFAAAGAFVVPCDFSLGMLQVGKHGKRGHPGLSFVGGDALHLPFAVTQRCEDQLALLAAQHHSAGDADAGVDLGAGFQR